MILQALYDYYQRKASDSDSNIAPFGMEWKEIPYVVVIDRQGNFLRIEERSEGNGKDRRTHRFLVPQSKARSGSGSWQVAFDFWDHYGYLLGIPKSSAIKQETGVQKAVEDAIKQNGTFLEVVKKYCILFPGNEQFSAVSAFYLNEQNKEAILKDPLWEAMIKKDGTNISFRLVDEDNLVAQHEDLRIKQQIEEGTTMGVCLITGERAPIRALHTGLMIPGGKAGSKIVGFQTNSGYDSYGKEQGFNAPVSVDAESSYSTALKELLDKDSPNKFRLCDTQFLFWAQRKCEFEEYFPLFFAASSKDNPDRNINAIRALMQAPHKGTISEQEETEFYGSSDISSDRAVV